MIIEIHNSEKVELNLNKRYIEKRFEKIAFFEKYIIKHINFIFVIDKNIFILNTYFLHHTYPTDVITFDYSKSIFLEGDLYISVESVRKNSEKYKNTFKQELYRVMIHGMLHLMHYNDKSYLEKRMMKNKENYYLKLFNNII